MLSYVFTVKYVAYVCIVEDRWFIDDKTHTPVNPYLVTVFRVCIPSLNDHGERVGGEGYLSIPLLHNSLEGLSLSQRWEAFSLLFCPSLTAISLWPLKDRYAEWQQAITLSPHSTQSPKALHLKAMTLIVFSHPVTLWKELGLSDVPHLEPEEKERKRNTLLLCMESKTTLMSQ